MIPDSAGLGIRKTVNSSSGCCEGPAANPFFQNNSFPNGKLLLDVITKYSIKTVNFHPACEGKWTRQITKDGNLERSVIDYMMSNDMVVPMVDSMCIDEHKLITPYNVVKHKKVTKQIFSDHNSMLLKLS